MLGVVGGYETIDLSPRVDDNLFRAGAEGELYLDNLTLGLAGGYAQANARISAPRNAFFLSPRRFRNELGYGSAQVRYYFGDNLKVELGGGAFPGSARDSYIVHAGAEYKFDELPLSLFARWNGTFFDNSPENRLFVENTDNQQALAGLKLYFGGVGDTIKHYDRAYFSDSCTFQGANSGFC